MLLKDLRIAFLGDSITFGAGVDKPENRFTDVISRETGAVCLNYGISGTRIAKQTNAYNEHFDVNDFIVRCEKMDESAGMVVVFGGTNDYGHGDAPIGTPADRDAYSFYGAMHLLCQKLIERYPGKPIVFMTPMHRLNENSIGKDKDGKPKGTLKNYVDIIREVAEVYSLPVLDMYASSCIQPSVEIIKSTFMPDGLHPNGAGHRMIANKLIKFIESL